jgi:thioredoxin 1
MRPLLLGLLAVAIALSVMGWLNRPESPPPPIDGIEVTLTDDDFQREVLEHPGYVLVDFWFEKCPPCRRMKPVVAHLSVNYRDRVKVGKMDIDEHVAVPQRYGLNAFPTLLLFRDGELVARWEGYGGLTEMSRWLDEQLAAGPAGA